MPFTPGARERLSHLAVTAKVQESYIWSSLVVASNSLKVVFRYRDVEHEMGLLPGRFTGIRCLDPFVSRLNMAGVHRGRLLVIDATSGDIVAIRQLRSPKEPAKWPGLDEGETRSAPEHGGSGSEMRQ
jgi:hypothetical protein